MKRLFLACVLAGMTPVMNASAQGAPCPELQKVFSPELQPGVAFGYSMDMEGDTMVVGAIWEGRGVVRVFTRVGGAWTFEQALEASNPLASNYGWSLALSGSLLAVTAEAFDGQRGGAAYIYERVGGTWTERAELRSFGAPQVNSDFGDSVAISPDAVVVGDPIRDVVGAALVFDRHGASWTPGTILVASNPGQSDLFGSAVAIQGSTILVGAWGADRGPNNGQGAVYVFDRMGAGWTQSQELAPTDPARATFGMRLDLDGNTAVIGAPNARGPAASSGAAYVFTRAGGTWAQQAKLLPSDGVDDDYFARSVRVDGDAILIGSHNDGVGSSGGAYLYTRSGLTWSESKLVTPDPSPHIGFGYSAGLSGGRAGVAAIFANHPDQETVGAVYFTECDVQLPAIACSAGPDVSAACNGTTLLGSADADNGAPTRVHWSSSCPGVTFAPSAEILEPMVSSAGACGETCEIELVATLPGGSRCSDSMLLTFADASPPRIVAEPLDDRCLWPPDHRWTCFEKDSFHPLVEDDCAVAWSLSSCSSSQDEDGRGDGNSSPDCLIDPSGGSVCLRVERSGRAAGGRTYTLSARAVDECGNSTEAPIALIHVPRDQRDHAACGGPRRRSRQPPR